MSLADTDTFHVIFHPNHQPAEHIHGRYLNLRPVSGIAGTCKRCNCIADWRLTLPTHLDSAGESMAYGTVYAVVELGRSGLENLGYKSGAEGRPPVT